MTWRRKRSPLRVGENGGMSAAAIALQLARLRVDGELHHCDVHLTAEAVDHHEAFSEEPDAFFRVFLVRALSWPALKLPEHQRVPVQWKSGVISVPGLARDDPRVLLTDFEAEFAVRGFLHRIEREIDGVFRRAEEYNQSWPRR
ncbi:MAG: hypothetical protein WC709_09170 [Thermoleophilia bacterium]